jgi:hypothetical protein
VAGSAAFGWVGLGNHPRPTSVPSLASLTAHKPAASAKFMDKVGMNYEGTLLDPEGRVPGPYSPATAGMISSPNVSRGLISWTFGMFRMR